MNRDVLRDRAPAVPLVILIGLFLSILGCGLPLLGSGESDFETQGSEPLQMTSLPAEEEPGLSSPTAGPAPVETIPEQRLLTFEWPESIRVGDSDILRLALELDEDGSIIVTPFFEDHALFDERVLIENLYETHLVRVESRLDLAGAEIQPTGTVMQRMLPGEPIIFTWSIKPRDEGIVRGNVWMYVRYLPQSGESNEEFEKLIFSQPLEIEALNFLGLGGLPARVVGILGILVSSIIGLDDVLRVVRKVLKI